MSDRRLTDALAEQRDFKPRCACGRRLSYTAPSNLCSECRAVKAALERTDGEARYRGRRPKGAV